MYSKIRNEEGNYIWQKKTATQTKQAKKFIRNQHHFQAKTLSKWREWRGSETEHKLLPLNKRTWQMSDKAYKTLFQLRHGEIFTQQRALQWIKSFEFKKNITSACPLCGGLTDGPIHMLLRCANPEIRELINARHNDIVRELVEALKSPFGFYSDNVITADIPGHYVKDTKHIDQEVGVKKLSTLKAMARKDRILNPQDRIKIDYANLGEDTSSGSDYEESTEDSDYTASDQLEYASESSSDSHAETHTTTPSLAPPSSRRRQERKNRVRKHTEAKEVNSDNESAGRSITDSSDSSSDERKKNNISKHTVYPPQVGYFGTDRPDFVIAKNMTYNELDSRYMNKERIRLLLGEIFVTSENSWYEKKADKEVQYVKITKHLNQEDIHHDIAYLPFGCRGFIPETTKAQLEKVIAKRALNRTCTNITRILEDYAVKLVWLRRKLESQPQHYGKSGYNAYLNYKRAAG